MYKSPFYKNIDLKNGDFGMTVKTYLVVEFLEHNSFKAAVVR